MDQPSLRKTGMVLIPGHQQQAKAQKTMQKRLLEESTG
jgi:hypothetical protein